MFARTLLLPILLPPPRKFPPIISGELLSIKILSGNADRDWPAAGPLDHFGPENVGEILEVPEEVGGELGEWARRAFFCGYFSLGLEEDGFGEGGEEGEVDFGRVWRGGADDLDYLL